MNVIEVQGITKIYNNKQALKNVSFQIQKDTITGLIGRNGAGKTTLLKILAGFYTPSSGDVKVFGENPFNSITVSSNMVFIDDNMLFPPGLNLYDILSSAESFYPNWDMELAMKLFEYFDLRKKHSHHHLSKGMKSTFNMIIGLASRASLTILDEPTTGMDASVRSDFYKALLKDYLDHPRTIIISSHLLNEIESILEDILLIRNGEKFLHLSVDELKEYAIGIRGKAGLVEEVTAHMDIIHQEMYGSGYLYQVVKNNTSDLTVSEAKKLGVEVVPVSVADLCVYLTSKHKGGIDDVFNKG